ncbi:suppressor of fused homolog isoform X2 [Pseudomyrmex gracilis]|uniref:suppressor of fused homolog isoform X2 n=1 Tax=Pseudomyrmex gracilis TaxID=219809 RepID=UPI000995131A|nr:suppressor of fused homolog isoform X2 [Pseudomyrmex gracilis]
MYGTNMRECEEFARCFPPGQPVQASPPSLQAPGLDALHRLCKQIYPDQSNPLTVTAVLKYWLGGPDPLDYISMYANPGCPKLGVPPHWHYVSLGLSDLHGDGRLHPKPGPGRPSGFGFELTFRLARERGETTPPTWPATVMQQLAKYVFNSGNTLMPGDHVSWHAPLDGGNGRITQILMGQDSQFPASVSTPHGEVSFVQIVGVTSEELQAAQHWNGLGVVNLLKSARDCGPWLVTDMRRMHSAMEDDPSIAERIQSGIERDGSNTSGVSAKCWWVQITNDRATEKYRERRDDSDDNDDDDDDDDDEDVKPIVKTERLSPCEKQDVNVSDENSIKVLPGLHLTFNLEAGSLLPGRVMHGRHFTFKSIVSNSAVTIVAPSVTGTFVSKEKPYVVQGPWLQVLLSEELAEKMAEEFQVLSSTSNEIELPKTFSWPEHNLVITIIND